MSILFEANQQSDHQSAICLRASGEKRGKLATIVPLVKRVFRNRPSEESLARGLNGTRPMQVLRAWDEFLFRGFTRASIHFEGTSLAEFVCPADGLCPVQISEC